MKPALHEGKIRTIHVTRVCHYYEPKDTKSHRIPENLDKEDEVDDGDELAENLHPGIQMVEPRDLLLPVDAPQPLEEIKDIPFNKPIQPRRELEAITPLQPQQDENSAEKEEIETPMNASNSSGEDTDVTMSNSIVTRPEQQGPTGGVKRKFLEPLPDHKLLEEQK